jgi:nucleotide-binding universal stress UspA family protein
LAQAVELARWYDAELHVAHVRGGRVRRQTADEPSNTDGVDRRLSSFMEAVDAEGLRLSTVTLAGDPVTAVSEHARLIAADLVVVAKHGRRYGMYWRPGVYAKDLARVLPCPTLAVPDAGPRYAQGSFSNILCPTDFSAASAAALQKALILAQQSGGRLTLLHVLEGFPYGTVYSGGEAFRLIGEYRARVDKVSREMRSEVPPDAFNWCHIDTKAVSGIAHRAIVSTASELSADLIVMGLPERSGIDRVIMASTATPVLRSAVCPVLMVRASAGEVSRATAGEIGDAEGALFATNQMSVEPSRARIFTA